MSENKFAVIGEKSISYIFRTIGGDIFSPSGEKETRKTLISLIKSYKLIFIFSNFARFVSDIIDETQSQSFPVILVLGDSENDEFMSGKIDDSVKRALGINLNLD